MKHRKVGNVMTSDVISVGEAVPFKEVAGLLARHRISGVPVVDEDDKVTGVISESDLVLRQAREDAGAPRRRLWRTRSARVSAAKAGALTAAQLMSSPPITVRAVDSIAHSARIMADHRVERLPVLDEEQRLVGIVTRSDVLQVFLRTDADIRQEVVDEILVRTLWLVPTTVAVRVDNGVVTLEGLLERESEVGIAVRMTAQIDGVVSVVDNLTARYDDSHLPSAPTSTHGVADAWLKKI